MIAVKIVSVEFLWGKERPKAQRTVPNLAVNGPTSWVAAAATHTPTADKTNGLGRRFFTDSSETTIYGAPTSFS